MKLIINGFDECTEEQQEDIKNYLRAHDVSFEVE